MDCTCFYDVIGLMPNADVGEQVIKRLYEKVIEFFNSNEENEMSKLKVERAYDWLMWNATYEDEEPDSTHQCEEYRRIRNVIKHRYNASKSARTSSQSSISQASSSEAHLVMSSEKSPLPIDTGSDQSNSQAAVQTSIEDNSTSLSPKLKIEFLADREPSHSIPNSL